MITSVFSVHVNPWQRFWSFQVVCANDAKASPGHRWCLLHLCISGAQKSKMWNVEVENSVNLLRLATFVSLSRPMLICFGIISSSICFAPRPQQGFVQIHGRTVLPISIHFIRKHWCKPVTGCKCRPCCENLWNPLQSWKVLPERPSWTPQWHLSRCWRPYHTLPHWPHWTRIALNKFEQTVYQWSYNCKTSTVQFLKVKMFAEICSQVNKTNATNPSV